MVVPGLAAGVSFLSRPWFAAAMLLAVAGSVVLAAGELVILRLEPRQLNSSELMKMDERRLARRGLMAPGGVVDFPVVGTGIGYLAGG
jgi:hypothetical protein